jgi:hypothetical protein
MLMPKASMDKDNSAMLRQDKIGFSGEVFSVQAEPEPHPMKGRANHFFRNSVFALDLAHVPASSFF